MLVAGGVGGVVGGVADGVMVDGEGPKRGEEAGLMDGVEREEDGEVVEENGGVVEEDGEVVVVLAVGLKAPVRHLRLQAPEPPQVNATPNHSSPSKSQLNHTCV